jgi:hypothetical protein
MTASSLGALWNRFVGKKPAVAKSVVAEPEAPAAEPEVAIEHVEHHVAEENIREVTGGDQVTPQA